MGYLTGYDHDFDGEARSVLHEIDRARAKFPTNKNLMIALAEEVGELAQALLQKKPNGEIYKEAIQVACVALRIAHEGDSDTGYGGGQ